MDKIFVLDNLADNLKLDITKPRFLAIWDHAIILSTKDQFNVTALWRCIITVRGEVEGQVLGIHANILKCGYKALQIG